MFSNAGYPPSDKSTYHYLVGSESQWEAFLRSCSFLHALFLQTTVVVNTFTGGGADKKFRDYMKEDMAAHAHGERRTKFYDDVESKAAVWNTSY
jgi:hypothetical protein